MSSTKLDNNTSYSDIFQNLAMPELTPKSKEDDICNICGQRLSEVKSKDIPDRKYFFVCFSCKTVKSSLEDKSIKVIID